MTCRLLQSYDEMMAEERNAALEDLLSRWHSWQQGYKAARGFKNRALVVGEYLVSRQYDDTNGALDGDLENFTMRQVDFEASELPEPSRTAIYCLAKALNLGLAVFTSPRLPSDPKLKAEVVRLAKERMQARLISAGVM